MISRAAQKALSRGARRSDIVTLEADLLDLDDDGAPPPPTEAIATAPIPLSARETSLHEAVDVCQRECIRAALQRHDGNWAGAARALGIDASNLHKLARRLGLKQSPGSRRG